MAVVLSPANSLTRNCPPEEDAYDQDWKQKYLDLQETLTATRADLEEFQLSSKELEEEMTLEIERTEKVQQELRTKVARIEREKDDWKSKFVSLQTTHNTTTTSLQREIDTLRHQHQKYKVQLRELEIGNDDLERNERAVLSNLADVETKYSRVLEEKILLEQELLDKASLEEQVQRLKDELRDASEEISNLKRLLEQAQIKATTEDTARPPESDTAFNLSDSEVDGIQKISTDLQLSDLISELPEAYGNCSNVTDDITSTQPSLVSQTATPSSANIPHIPLLSSHITPSVAHRSGLPVLSPHVVSSARARTLARPPVRPVATSGNQNLATKSKGVQMISALRSRVQTTQQRLIPGIPRLRLGSTAGRTLPPGLMNSVRTPVDTSKRSGFPPSDGVSSNSLNDIDRKSGAQSPGWVLIQTQGDSPSESDKMRPSSISSVTPSVYKSGIPRRPASRLSLTGTDESPSIRGGRLSADSSSLALSSRPSTPTFLPVPVAGHMKSSKSNATGPSAFAASVYNPRRSSLEAERSKSPYPGSITTLATRNMSALARPTSVPVPPRSSFSSSSRPASGRTSALAKSRIGKPARKSITAEQEEPLKKSK